MAKYVYIPQVAVTFPESFIGRPSCWRAKGGSNDMVEAQKNGMLGKKLPGLEITKLIFMSKRDNHGLEVET